MVMAGVISLCMRQLMPVMLFWDKICKDSWGFRKKCNEAEDQINERRYEKNMRDDFDKVLCYGLSLSKKRCITKKKQIQTI